MRLTTASLLLIATVLTAEEAVTLGSIEVNGHRQNILGKSLSASEGIVGSKEIEQRPLLRTGEVLEFIPGMVVTQHSGTGKANQYFLRGFNLDHGTDFATYLEGMPLNMRTHGHGQGYTDLNFIIPETIESIRYSKGSYSADSGDFSAAGSAHFSLKNNSESEVILTYGEYNYLRAVGIVSEELGNGKFYGALEYNSYDGPWSDINEDINKISTLLRYTTSLGAYSANFTLMAYDNSWNAADQIPQRAVNAGLIDTYGSIDEDAGGESSRYSLSASLKGNGLKANIYAVTYDMDLISNFTYLLEDPINGDEFEQVDKRSIYGMDADYMLEEEINDIYVMQNFGTQFRYDDISEVGLYHTDGAQRLGTIRDDSVKEASLALYSQTQAMLSDALTLTLGLRYDHYFVDVDAQLEANSGKDDAGIFSPKLNLIYELSNSFETYLSAGDGFHSNDARGATISIDPLSSEAANKVDMLVKTRGGELGFRYYDKDAMHLSLALWALDIDSELLYVGDAGTTEANRASRRYGVELSAYYWINDSFSADLELAYNHARFKEDDTEEGNYIEGSLPFVAAAGISYAAQSGVFGSLRMRHFGKRTLDSDNKERSDPSTLLNASAGYKFKNFKLWMEILNILDSKDHDIDYFYASRLDGEAADGVEDLHYHPLEPRMIRGGISYSF
jgi:outer membrane receptor protein involved in Fe transport